MRNKMIIIVSVFAFLCSGCSSAPLIDNEDANETGSMFELVERGGSAYAIVYHRETKVMYAVSIGYNNAGTFTVMLNADGSPLLWEGEDHEGQERTPTDAAAEGNT
nr:MAG TPA: Lysis protein [Caudoviricetes sp.]